MAVPQGGAAGSATTGSLFGVATLAYERDQVLTGKRMSPLKIEEISDMKTVTYETSKYEMSCCLRPLRRRYPILS